MTGYDTRHDGRRRRRRARDPPGLRAVPPGRRGLGRSHRLRRTCAAFHRPPGAAAGIPEQLLPGLPKPANPDPSLAATTQPYQLALHLRPAEPARAAAGRAGTAVLDLLRQAPDVGPQRPRTASTRSCTRPTAGRHQGHPGDVPRPPDRRRANRPHYAEPILLACAGLAVGGPISDQVSRQLAGVARDVREAVIYPGRSATSPGQPPWPRPCLATSSQAAGCGFIRVTQRHTDHPFDTTRAANSGQTANIAEYACGCTTATRPRT